MVKYLYMDGVDDLFEIPSLAFTSVELDISVEKTSAWGKYFSFNFKWFQQNSSGPNDQWETGSIGVVKKNGVTQSNLTDFVLMGERALFRIELIEPATNISYVFSYMTNSTQRTSGNIYNVKVYNGTTLVAHYDMSTGTAQDQSGNGNHATLVGGTWLDDGTGGGADVPRQIGTLKINGSTLPIMELTNTTKALRIRTQTATGYLDLVDPTDATASNLRINTSSGVKAIRKL